MGSRPGDHTAIGHRPGFFYLQHAMGLASSIGLGLALNLPDEKVVVLDGDGSALELLAGSAQNNGGLTGGMEIWNENLVLNVNPNNKPAGISNVQFGDAPLHSLSDDNMWRGPVTLNTSAAAPTNAGISDPVSIWRSARAAPNTIRPIRA